MEGILEVWRAVKGCYSNSDKRWWEWIVAFALRMEKRGQFPTSDSHSIISALLYLIIYFCIHCNLNSCSYYLSQSLMLIWNEWVLKLIGISQAWGTSEHYSLHNLYISALNRLPWWWVLVMRYKYIELKPQQSPWLGMQQGDRIWFPLCLCSKRHDIFVQECSLWSVKYVINITSAHFSK